MSEDIISVSWSKLKTWSHCHQKAWLQSSHKKSPSFNTRVFIRGTVTDRILRDWIQNPDREANVMPGMVDEFVELCQQEQKDQGTGIVRWKHANDKDEVIVWCKELLRRVEPIMQELVTPYFPNVEADKRLSAIITIPGLQGEPRKVKLIGILDLLIDHPDLLAVYDLKATENENYYRQTIMQLVFYHMMVAATYGKVPSKTALIQPMCKEQIKSLVITDKHVLDLTKHIMDYAHSVWRDEHDPKESDAGCMTFCDVRHACEKFKKNADGKMSWL